jgi:response regulator RpfG family c-di-GMP phosphodiesterase
MAMPERILCVDDDPAILSAYQRALRKVVEMDTATGGDQGLQALITGTKYAMVVSDMNMPGMNGIQFLTKAKELAPDAVRVMLTGASDLHTAMQAVNEGNIFRFLTKPCEQETLVRTVEAGLRQYRLVMAERELLEKTLAGAVSTLTEMLSLIDAESFGRVEAMRGDIRKLACQLGITDIWEVEVAAMLSQIGRVTVPPVVLLKAQTGRALSEAEQDMLCRVPEVGGMLLANIPRLESAGRIVLYIDKRFDGSGFPFDSTKGESIPLGARMLRLLFDLAEAEHAGKERLAALVDLRKREGWYDPVVIDAAMACLLGSPSRHGKPVIIQIATSQLRPGMILRSDIVTTDGQRLVSAGQTISGVMLERLANFARITSLVEPVRVETTSSEPRIL